MRAKCIEICDNYIVLKDATEKLITIDTTKEDYIDLINNYIVFNLEGYNIPKKFRLCNIDASYMRRYIDFADKNSHRSDETFNKALLLKIINKDGIINKGIYDRLIITDKNNICEEGKIRADEIWFKGDNPLIHMGDEPTIFICKKAIIDNRCVYGNLIINGASNIIIYADEVIVKHQFIDINTVDEVYCIFRESYGLDTIHNNEYSGAKFIYYIRKYGCINVKFDLDRITPSEIYDRTKSIVTCDDNIITDDSNVKVAVMIAKLYLIISMYKSTKCYKPFKNLAKTTSSKLNNIKYSGKSKVLSTMSDFALKIYNNTFK